MAKPDHPTKAEFEDLYAQVKAHLLESRSAMERLAVVEEELIGNQDTGRPSLRNELTAQNKSLKRVALAILTALIIGIAGNWLGIGAHAARQSADQQTQGK